MPKVLNLWEMDNSRMPTDPTERAALIGKLMEMTKKMLDEGKIQDWGVFAGGGAGYGIGDMSAMDTLKNSMQFAPYVKFHPQQALSIDEAAEVMKSLMG